MQESAGVSQLVEHLFRHESGKMVATLTGIFGIEHLNLAEDVVQEALARALQTWPYRGIPENPAAWIMRASRNLALDVVRREKVFRAKEPEIARLMERDGSAPEAAIFSEHEIADDRLRMMFVCCHPVIPPEAQVPLALKTLCGFSVTEISHAFLTTEAAIAKRLTRAKQKIQEAQVPFEIPTGDELTRRLDSVLQSLYLLFNEGYKASSGENLVREELCDEAIRLTELLEQHRASNQPKTHALLALMLLNAARIPARQDNEGNLLRLKEQDRAVWDQTMIARGMFHLHESAAGTDISEYHLQAGIAACHATAIDYKSTDWAKILSLYDRLIEFDDSPVVALNRAVAVANVHGPETGLQTLRAIRNREKLDSYYLFYSVFGELEMRLNNHAVAAEQFRKAFELAETKSERAFLLKRLQRCVDGQIA
ncbi:MAG: sigma factor, ECF subfamily protein [Verrucomicrobia bacterium]|nr:MAG: sigma factor, ECF subfamily protein [Verrucomicrobiota bacterium]PYK50434.1 MAG: sigma factor, ECF subfamily protein [Verrucomicrobiota bacterium]